MSTEVNNQVVQMSFNNKQFEKGASDTIKTVEKLKVSLNFDGVQKGLNDMSKMLATLPVGIGHVVSKEFNTAWSATDQFVRKVTNSIIGSVQQATNTLNIFKNGLQTGFSEYETKIGAVQTIWANTKDSGATMDDITRVLEELNLYADKTIYNFTEMTRNIGTFTAAGIGLEESSKAIQGIANLAAISGSTSQQASTAMYQLSQALASGRVALMDWNSVVNAGMGGKVFQNVLIETAQELGTINSEFANALKSGEKNFRETLTTEGWITSEVLTASLTKFTDTSTELGKTATEAATKVKTFTQLIDTLKESVQSGWTQSWEYIIGDFETARDLFTTISNKITSLIQPSMDARNEMLAIWAGVGEDDSYVSGRDHFLEGLFEMGKNLELILNEISSSFKTIFAPVTGERLVELSKKFEEFTKRIKPSDKALKALGASIKIVLRVFKMLGKTVKDVGGGLLSAINSSINYDIIFDWIISAEEKLAAFEAGVNKIDIWSAIENGAKKFINAVTNTFNKLKNYISELGELKPGVAFEKIFGDISSGVVTMFDAIRGGEGAETNLNGLLAFLQEFNNTLEWIATRFSSNLEIVGNMFTALWEDLHMGEFVSSWNPIRFLTSLGEAINNMVKNMTVDDIQSIGLILMFNELKKLFTGMTGLANTAKTTLETFSKPLSQWLKKASQNFRTLPELMLLISVSIGIFVASMWVLSKMDMGKAIGAVTMITVILAELLVATWLLKKFSTRKEDDPEVNFLPIFATLAILTSAITQLALTAAVLGKLDKGGDMWNGLAMITAIGGLLIIAMYTFSKLSEEADKSATTAKALVRFGFALNQMILPIVVLSLITREGSKMNVDKAVSIIANMTVIAGLFLGLTTKLTNSADLTVSGKAFFLFGLALNMLIAPLVTLSILMSFNDNVLAAVGVLGAVMGVASLMLALTTVLTKGGDLAVTAGAFVTLSGGILVVAIALSELAKADANKVVKAAKAINKIMIAMGVLIGVLSVIFGIMQFFGLGLALPLIIGTLAALVLSFSALGFAISSVLNAMTNFSDGLIRFSNADFSKFGDNIKTICLGIVKNLDIMGGTFGEVLKAIAKAIYDNSANIGTAIGALIASTIVMVVKTVKELMPVLTELADVILELVFLLLGKIAELVYVSLGILVYGLVKTFFLAIRGALDASAEEIPPLIESLNNFLNAFGDSLIENGESIHAGCEKIMDGIKLCLFGKDFEGAYVLAFGGFMGGVLGKTFSENSLVSFAALSAGTNLASWIKDGMASNQGETDMEAAKLGNGAVASVVSSMKQDAIDAGYYFSSNVAEGMEDGATSELIPYAKNLSKTIPETVTKENEAHTLNDDGIETGLYYTDGIGTGIDNGLYENVIPSADNLTNSLVDRVNSNLKIESPSRVGMVIGNFFSTGVGIGIADGSKKAVKESDEMATGIKDALLGALGDTEIGKSVSNIFDSAGGIKELFDKGFSFDKIGDILGLDDIKNTFNSDNIFDNMGLDTTITPVMDLSDFSSGISDMNSMFNSSPMGLSSLNSSLNSSLDVGDIQNGSYDDTLVINSINNLNARIDALATAVSSIQIRMDTGALVGSIAGPMDSALGQRAVYAGRGIR